MRGINGDLMPCCVSHDGLTHATAQLVTKLVEEELLASGDSTLASLITGQVPEARNGGGFRLALYTSDEQDATELAGLLGPCRDLVVRVAGSIALHPSVEGVVEALRTGRMAQPTEVPVN